MSTARSKFLSLVLRHDPARIGITLDRAGWTDVAALLVAAAAHGMPITRAELAEIVATSDKQRFALSGDGTRIRANQGHSVEVELSLAPVEPPAVLYHGTVDRYVHAIRAKGLVKGERQHVHLSADRATAENVGSRRGEPVVLEVRAGEMSEAGHAFFVSANGVWLTEAVPSRFIDFPVTPGAALVAARVEIAASTLAACEAGFYLDAAGARVSIGAAIEAAKAGTALYELGISALAVPLLTRPATIEVTNESTLAALTRLAEGGHVACLNFASARNPGGGFLGGAQAQEESLARSSALYPCLLTQMAHYERNRGQPSALYLDLAIWSPLVPCFRDDVGGWLATPVLASVITCAAPNAGALGPGTTGEELRATLERRARFVLEIARHHRVDTLVLGAWGAGVFRNDPVVVAGIFKRLLDQDFASAFQRVVFAVLGTTESSANHRAFSEAFAR